LHPIVNVVRGIATIPAGGIASIGGDASASAIAASTIWAGAGPLQEAQQIAAPSMRRAPLIREERTRLAVTLTWQTRDTYCRRSPRGALALPEDQRAQVAEKLAASLDGEVEPDAEAHWGAEIERRLARIDGGQAKSLSMDESLARLHRIVRG